MVPQVVLSSFSLLAAVLAFAFRIALALRPPPRVALGLHRLRPPHLQLDLLLVCHALVLVPCLYDCLVAVVLQTLLLVCLDCSLLDDAVEEEVDHRL